MYGPIKYQGMGGPMEPLHHQNLEKGLQLRPTGGMQTRRAAKDFRSPRNNCDWKQDSRDLSWMFRTNKWPYVPRSRG